MDRYFVSLFFLSSKLFPYLFRLLPLIHDTTPTAPATHPVQQPIRDTAYRFILNYTLNLLSLTRLHSKNRKRGKIQIQRIECPAAKQDLNMSHYPFRCSDVYIMTKHPVCLYFVHTLSLTELIWFSISYGHYP